MKNFITLYLETTRLAMQSILAHKLRTFLTLIGIIIGVASVVVVGASIDGLNTYVTKTISNVLGVNHFMIDRMASSENLSEEEWEEMDRRNKYLHHEDYQWVSEHCPTCTEVGAQLQTRTDLKYENNELLGTRTQGVTANMAEIENKKLIAGRFIMKHEVDSAAMVCVIGTDVRDKFFPNSDPLGKTIKVTQKPMVVVGIEEKRGSILGNSFDNVIYIPISTYERLFGRRQSVQIHGKSGTREDLNTTMDEARLALRAHHKLKVSDKDDFGLVNVENLNRQVDQFTGAIAVVVTPITLISLIVGGIVVMNIMLVSVTERTFEIGLRKALGARRRQILLQFLIESSILSSFGGLFGLLLAALISKLITITTSITMSITPFYIILSLTVSGGVGLLFGIYPAYRASKLDPIIALTRN